MMLVNQIILQIDDELCPHYSDKCFFEPIVMKVTRWVLRREGGGDPSDLSDGYSCTFMINFITMEKL